MHVNIFPNNLTILSIHVYATKRAKEIKVTACFSLSCDKYEMLVKLENFHLNVGFVVFLSKYRENIMSLG